MRYIVEDTPHGFRLTTYPVVGAVPLERRAYRPGGRIHDEIGGHGPVEALYAQAERAYEATRRAKA